MKNFLGVRGCKTKNLPWGEYGYFLELHNLIQISYLVTLSSDNVSNVSNDIFL